MIETIQERLRKLERERGISILYACESGSRAWGFASPDSDFDVRFLFRYPLATYLGVCDAPNTIDLLEGDLDLSGWELRKAARLLGRSNGALLEWLRSPIVYYEAPGFLDAWLPVADQRSPRALLHHYRGMAKNTLLGKLADPTRRPKDYLYALRATLAALWILDGRGPVPVPFHDLLPTAPAPLLPHIDDLLHLKASTPESHRVEPIEDLDHFLTTSLQRLHDEADLLSPDGPDQPSLDALTRRSLFPTASPQDFTLTRIRQPHRLLLDVIAGSHAYGTAVETSDTDRRGIFVAPPAFLLCHEAIPQITDDRNDHVYYELGRFIDLAIKSNPNVLELLAIPPEFQLTTHPLMDLLTPELFLSQQCGRTFGQYAMGQIRKARGLNKKIRNPEPRERKQALEFCFVLQGQGTTPLPDWLDSQGLTQQDCGITAVPRARDLYALYTPDSSASLQGIFSPLDPDTLVFSSVDVDARPAAWLSFQRDAFRAHCKAHREYWAWVEDRNEARFHTNTEHGRGYDSKNLMHTFRLLHMAHDIATEGILRVRRPERDHLLRIRNGEFAYDHLVAEAEELLQKVEEAFAASPLPDAPDEPCIRGILLEIRTHF